MLTVSLLFCDGGKWRVKWLEVRDRNWSQQYTSDMPWAAISISQSRAWPSLQIHNRAALLQLSFKDCHNSDDYYRAFLFGGMFSLNHAEQILSFMDRHWECVDSFLVQCETGRCCAPAIAAAITYLKYGEGQWYFDNLEPNLQVYNTILKQYSIRFLK